MQRVTETQNTILYAMFNVHTRKRIYESINAANGFVFKSQQQFEQDSLLGSYLENSESFGFALSYVWSKVQEQINIYLDEKNKRCDFTKAQFVMLYRQHVMCFAARPNCPDSWGLDQYIAMGRTLDQFFKKLFDTNLNV